MFRGGYRFCGSEAHTSFGTLFIKKIMNAKLGTKVNICIGPLPGPWKGPMQVRSPEV